MTPNLSWVRRFVYMNRYTGSAVFDEVGASESEELRQMKFDIWESGYSAGFADGDGDSYVETQAVNPYRSYR